MPYVTSFERAGIKKGLQQGLKQGLQQGLQQGMILEAQEMVIQALEARFDSIPSSLASQIKAIDSVEKLKGCLKKAIKAADVEEFTKALQES